MNVLGAISSLTEITILKQSLKFINEGENCEAELLITQQESILKDYLQGKYITREQCLLFQSSLPDLYIHYFSNSSKPFKLDFASISPLLTHKITNDNDWIATYKPSINMMKIIDEIELLETKEDQYFNIINEKREILDEVLDLFETQQESESELEYFTIEKELINLALTNNLLCVKFWGMTTHCKKLQRNHQKTKIDSQDDALTKQVVQDVQLPQKDDENQKLMEVTNYLMTDQQPAAQQLESCQIAPTQQQQLDLINSLIKEENSNNQPAIIQPQDIEQSDQLIISTPPTQLPPQLLVEERYSTRKKKKSKQKKEKNSEKATSNKIFIKNLQDLSTLSKSKNSFKTKRRKLKDFNNQFKLKTLPIVPNYKSIKKKKQQPLSLLTYPSSPMSLSASRLLEEKYRLPKTHVEQSIQTKQLFKVTITNYKMILEPFREILATIPLTTTSSQIRNILAQEYAKTRIQINSENNASTSYAELRNVAAHWVGEMTKIGLQTIHVLSSEQLSSLWQFSHLNTKSMDEAMSEFFEKCIASNEGHLSQSEMENAKLDFEQLEQIIAMSYALSVFARQKDLSRNSSQETDSFFDQIPYVFVPHFQLMANLLNPEQNPKFQQYQSAETYRTVINLLFNIAFERIARSDILNHQLLCDIENAIRHKQFSEKTPKIIAEVVRDQIKKKREAQLATERLEQINSKKYHIDKQETQWINQLKTLLKISNEGDSEETRILREAEAYFESYNDERQAQVLTAFFTYLAQSEILAGKASRVEQINVRKILEFCTGISQLWVQTMQKLCGEFHHAYTKMNQVHVTSVNTQGLTPQQEEQMIIVPLSKILHQITHVTSEQEEMINKATKTGTNIANFSPYYMNRTMQKNAHELPYHWTYSLPTSFESVKGNTYQLDVEKQFKERILKLWENANARSLAEGKKLSVETFVAESGELHTYISTLAKGSMNSTGIKEVKRLPKFASINELQQFNQVIYELINISISLEGKEQNDEVTHLATMKIKEKFQDMQQTGIGKLIDKCEDGRTRIKSPDSLTFYMCFLSSALLATFRLKSKSLATKLGIQSQRTAFDDEIIKPEDLTRNVEQRLRQFAIIAYQDFIRKRIQKLNMDKEASRDAVLEELWDQTAQLVAEVACKGSVLNECCETANIQQQSQQSVQYNIQKLNFLADFSTDYHSLDDSLNRDTTWSELAIKELTKTIEKKVKQLIIILTKMILEQPVKDKELLFLKHLILYSDTFNLVTGKNHKHGLIFYNFICQPGLERIPEQGECGPMAGGFFGSIGRFFKGTAEKIAGVARHMLPKGIELAHGVKELLSTVRRDV